MSTTPQMPLVASLQSSRLGFVAGKAQKLGRRLNALVRSLRVGVPLSAQELTVLQAAIFTADAISGHAYAALELHEQGGAQ